ncbi:MAG TPA: hypothetical protein PL110_14280 [Candidatus Eremiobacteraeota bacterium]|nr:hypothetical protein [Candidatus Eremiobacteraeota bacterium]
MKNKKYLLLFLILLLIILPLQSITHRHNEGEESNNCNVCQWLQTFFSLSIFFFLLFEITLLFKPLSIIKTVPSKLYISHVYSSRDPPEI